MEVELSGGVTELEITGDLEGTFEGSLEGEQTVEMPLGEEGSDVSLLWVLETADEELSIEGTLREGSQETSDELTVEYRIDDAVFISQEGECTVDVSVEEQTLEGTLTCEGLESEDGTATIGVDGDVEAAPAGD